MLREGWSGVFRTSSMSTGAAALAAHFAAPFASFPRLSGTLRSSSPIGHRSPPSSTPSSATPTVPCSRKIVAHPRSHLPSVVTHLPADGHTLNVERQLEILPSPGAMSPLPMVTSLRQGPMRRTVSVPCCVPAASGPPAGASRVRFCTPMPPSASPICILAVQSVKRDHVLACTLNSADNGITTPPAVPSGCGSSCPWSRLKTNRRLLRLCRRWQSPARASVCPPPLTRLHATMLRQTVPSAAIPSQPSPFLQPSLPLSPPSRP
jgi:hypothetical protein